MVQDFLLHQFDTKTMAKKLIESDYLNVDLRITYLEGAVVVSISSLLRKDG